MITAFECFRTSLDSTFVGSVHCLVFALIAQLFVFFAVNVNHQWSQQKRWIQTKVMSTEKRVNHVIASHRQQWDIFLGENIWMRTRTMKVIKINNQITSQVSYLRTSDDHLGRVNRWTTKTKMYSRANFLLIQSDLPFEWIDIGLVDTIEWNRGWLRWPSNQISFR